jgi:branched-chain amino acid transport system substrate-binding protein
VRRTCLALLGASILLTVGCGRKLIVGVVLPETGENKLYGESLKSGIKLALDEAVARQIPKGIEARYRDTLSHPEYAAREAEELFQSGALIIIGGATSAEAKAMIPVANKAKGILISPSASEPDLAATSNLFFRIVPSDEFEADVAADFLTEQKKAKTILVLFQKGAYADGFLPIFNAEVEKHGAKLLTPLPVGPSDWDKAVADAVGAEKPDAIFICTYAEEALAALRVIHQAKYPGTVCVTSAIDSGNVVRRAGEAGEGVYVPLVTLDFSSQKEPMKSFVRRFKAANGGAKPDLFAAYGYDSALVAIEALQGRPPKDTSDLLVRLMSLGDRLGVTGNLAFDKSGNIDHHPRIHVIRDGKFEDVGTTPTP